MRTGSIEDDRHETGAAKDDAPVAARGRAEITTVGSVIELTHGGTWDDYDSPGIRKTQNH